MTLRLRSRDLEAILARREAFSYRLEVRSIYSFKSREGVPQGHGFDNIGNESLGRRIGGHAGFRRNKDVEIRDFSICQVLGFQRDKGTQDFHAPTAQTASIVRDDQSVAYSYDAAGQRLSAKTPAVGTTYEYDGMGRLLQIKHGSIAQYDYQWDAASRIIGINDSRDKRKYDYDKTSQLVGATYDKLPAEKYEYDLNGNRKNFTTGKNNQLLNDGESSYTYDAEGNRISKGNTKYHWDHRNRLVKVELPDETVEYAYDFRNRLVRRKTSKSVEYFVHDGWQIVQILDATGKVIGRYLWGARQDELISEKGNYALCDHLGTVRDMVDSSGKVISHLEYNVFGQLLSSTGQKPRFRYTGKFFDDDIGLQWNINRWYDNQCGRWISEDPIGFEGRDKNLYRFVGNNSIVFVDHNGLWKANVHYSSTFNWCHPIGFKMAACSAIAAADESTDGFSGGIGPIPPYSDQSYHFNRNFISGGDSRIDHKNDRFSKARNECSKLPITSRDPGAAATHIGVGLHALQDYYAHGDYGRIEPLVILLVHNIYGPPFPGAAGGTSDYPDDIALDAVGGMAGRPAGAALKVGQIVNPATGDVFTFDYAEYEFGSQRITTTASRTKLELQQFYQYLASNKTLCECRKFFTFLDD